MLLLRVKNGEQLLLLEDVPGHSLTRRWDFWRCVTPLKTSASGPRNASCHVESFVLWGWRVVRLDLLQVEVRRLCAGRASDYVSDVVVSAGAGASWLPLSIWVTLKLWYQKFGHSWTIGSKYSTRLYQYLWCNSFKATFGSKGKAGEL